MLGWVPGIGEDCEGKTELENEPPFLIQADAARREGWRRGFRPV